MSKLGAYGQNLAAAMKSERATTFEARNPLRASISQSPRSPMMAPMMV
jgi:hypothetical protein